MNKESEIISEKLKLMFSGIVDTFSRMFTGYSADIETKLISESEDYQSSGDEGSDIRIGGEDDEPEQTDILEYCKGISEEWWWLPRKTQNDFAKRDMQISDIPKLQQLESITKHKENT